MSNLLCKIGLHNWKGIELKSVEQIEIDVEYERKGENCGCDHPCMCSIPPRVYCEPFGRGYKEKKICRWCEKINDTITPYKIKIKPKVLRELELKEIGNGKPVHNPY